MKARNKGKKINEFLSKMEFKNLLSSSQTFECIRFHTFFINVDFDKIDENFDMIFNFYENTTHENSSNDNKEKIITLKEPKE